MRRQPRWPLPGLLPIANGLLWLYWGWHSGVVIAALVCPPALVLLAAGTALLLWPGDQRVNYWLTLSAFLSMPLAVILAWWLGALASLLLLVLGLGSALVGGYMSLQQAVVPAAMPERHMTLMLAAKAMQDNALLGFFQATVHIPRGQAVQREKAELQSLQDLTARQGSAQTPTALQPMPPLPQSVVVEQARARGHRFDWVAFASDYRPAEEMPGAARWLARRANQRMYARIFHHSDKARPWLLCIHGYQMGTPGLDLSLFRVAYLHHQLGLNLLMPILPLHGPRRATFVSGGLYLDGSLSEIFHAQSQALWDLRRCLAWLRSHYEVPRIGVLGYSLGGYNAALLAAFEPALACVIAGIPLADIPAVLWHHMPLADKHYFAACGLYEDWVSQVMAPISPLHLPVRVAPERRYIFAATGDQMIPPQQALALWRHWGEPSMHWYQGSHLSIRRETEVGAFMHQALHDSGLIPNAVPADTV